MKRKTIFFVMLLGLTGLLAIQSCKKTEGPDPKSYEAAMPANPAPPGHPLPCNLQAALETA